MDLDFYNNIIDISKKSDRADKSVWRLDQQYEGIYAEGARDKEVYFSPEKPDTHLIKPDWRYMFKLSRNLEWCPWQFWIEIIAYRLGCLIGVEVPPAHIGYNEYYKQNNDDICTPVYGALIEWFYNSSKDFYISGGQIMSDIIEGYDRIKGKQHNLETVISKIYEPEQYMHWAGIFTLDTLIANTDRHHDNWGWIFAENSKGKIIPKLSPAFDNGTAMEYSVREEHFYKYNDPEKLKAHLINPKRAKHHMKWSLTYNDLNYYDFMSKFILKFPASKNIINRYLCFDREQAEQILEPLCEIVSDQKYRLTPQRLKFMLDMVFRRKELLQKVLEK